MIHVVYRDTCPQRAAKALHDLGGMAGTWNKNYPRTLYSAPQRIGGELVDLSTPAKVKAYYEGADAAH